MFGKVGCLHSLAGLSPFGRNNRPRSDSVAASFLQCRTACTEILDKPTAFKTKTLHRVVTRRLPSCGVGIARHRHLGDRLQAHQKKLEAECCRHLGFRAALFGINTAENYPCKLGQSFMAGLVLPLWDLQEKSTS